MGFFSLRGYVRGKGATNDWSASILLAMSAVFLREKALRYLQLSR